MTAHRSTRAAAVLAVGLAIGLAGCRSGTDAAPSGATSTTSPASSAASELARPAAPSTTPHKLPPVPSRRPAHAAAPTGAVVLAGGVVLPNHSRTPGATSAAVTPATIHRTICLTGYTKTVRPPSSYTTALKERQLADGYSFHGDRNPRDYEEDHLIPLELGGAPSSAANLWPEPYTATDGARVKDTVENRLHDLVCSGRLSLRTAQRAIASNWWTAYQRYGGRSGSPQVYDGTYAGSRSSTTTTSGAGGSGATAQCIDGTYSYSRHRSGTCSHHGGVDHWINPPP